MNDKIWLRYTINADLYRAFGRKVSKKQKFLMLFNLINQGPKYISYMRLARYHNIRNNKLFAKFFEFLIMRMSVKYGVEIDYRTEIGEGLSIPHFHNITIAGAATIGKNCTILQGTTIGSNLFKARYEAASIGDNVLLGAGSKIIGPVVIGNNVTVGANSVVVHDIPDNAVVAGSPAKVISYKPAVKINQDYKSYEDFIL